jgi:hypothetical protein
VIQPPTPCLFFLLDKAPIPPRCDEGTQIDDGPEGSRSEWPIKAADESCNSDSQHKGVVGDQVLVERRGWAYHGSFRRRLRAFSWHAVCKGDETGRGGPLGHAAQR